MLRREIADSGPHLGPVEYRSRHRPLPVVEDVARLEAEHSREVGGDQTHFPPVTARRLNRKCQVRSEGPTRLRRKGSEHANASRSIKRSIDPERGIAVPVAVLIATSLTGEVERRVRNG